MLIVGLDQGFAADRRSTGVLLADLSRCRLSACDGPHHLSADAARDWLCGHLVQHRIACISVDAPLGIPAPNHYRPVDRVFSLGRFQRTCKPGSAGAPVGRLLADAAATTLARAGNTARYVPFTKLRQPEKGPTPVIESFPTTALAVMQAPSALPLCKRGEKTDRYFETLCANKSNFGGIELTKKLRPSAVTNHDERMSVICALVGAWFVNRAFRAVGSTEGYFVFPPATSWHRDWLEVLGLALVREPRARVVDV